VNAGAAAVNTARGAGAAAVKTGAAAVKTGGAAVNRRTIGGRPSCLERLVCAREPARGRGGIYI